MYESILTAVAAVLVGNVLVALTATVRRPVGDRWLLAILLSGTSGAAVIVVLSLLIGADRADAGRFVDVAMIFVALTALTAAVRVAATGPTSGGR